MKKLSSIFLLSLIFLLFSSCERPDLTDDVEWAYDVAKNNSCSEGAFKCSRITSLKCGSNGFWIAYEECDSGCDSSTGKCQRASSTEPTEEPSTEPTDTDSCKTIDGNMWSPKASSTMNWDDAVSYCNNLTECGYSDWRLPTIGELRNLIQNCSGTEPGGSCGVTDSCLSFDGCWNDPCGGCSHDSSGYYSKLGDDDNITLWSSSVRSDDSDYAWRVGFGYGHVGLDYKGSNIYVRCVR